MEDYGAGMGLQERMFLEEVASIQSLRKSWGCPKFFLEIDKCCLPAVACEGFLGHRTSTPGAAGRSDERRTAAGAVMLAPEISTATCSDARAL